MSDREDATVLVVDDDAALAEVYAAWLDEHYTVETATSGADALDALHEAVDVLLLDRRMPGMPGRAVLESVRDAGYDCRVAMVSGVRPDTDVVEMGFDDYLVKPVSGDDLVTTVERLLERQSYDDRLQEYYALASKRAALAVERDRGDPDGDLGDAIARLDDRLEATSREMTAVVDAFGFDDFRVAFRDLAEASDD